MKRIYNWKRPEEKKLFKCLATFFDDTTALPKSVDLRPFCPPIMDQGDLGSCTAHALAGAWGFLENQSILKKLPAPEDFKPEQYIPASRLFIYYQERSIEGDINQDGGANLADGIKSLLSVGCCQEGSWPYIPQKFNLRPSPEAYAEASQHKIQHAAELNGITHMKKSLSSGLPFVFGFTVYDNFESEHAAKTGVIGMPSGSIQGGHAVMCVGYDDDRQVAIVRNSWGADWGDKGYFYMPYEYIEDASLCDEFWVVSK